MCNYKKRKNKPILNGIKFWKLIGYNTLPMIKQFFKRGIAYLIDCIICYGVIMIIVQWGVLSKITDSIGITDEWFKNSWNMQLYVLITISLPIWIYFIYFDSKKSKGTFGKRIFNLTVINSKDGKKLDFKKSFYRTLLKLAPWEISHMGVIFPIPLYFDDNPKIRTLMVLGIILLIVYVVSILIDSSNRSIYDKLTNTYVTKN